MTRRSTNRDRSACATHGPRRAAIAIAVIAHLLVFAGGAAAQAPTRDQPLTPQFLEDRVRDELTSEGTDLASRNLRLHIEPIADAWLVSLVEITRGAAIASTRIDRLPADRDAAVAAMTSVVADLAAQIDDRGEPGKRPPAAAEPSPAAPPPAPGEPPSAERRQAELRYREHSLRFAAMYRVTIEQGIHSVQRQWLVLRGDPGEVVPPHEFYRAIGRDDLVRAVGRRRALMIGGYIVGALGFAVTIVQTVILFNGDACGVGTPGRSSCYDLTSYPLVPWLSTLGIGVAGLVVGTHYLRHPEPIEDDEARALADEYNARLRRGLGLTRATPRPVLRDVTLTPYVLGREGGLAIRTRF